MKKLLFILTFTVLINCRTILITGAAGFIGSNFLAYMFEKHPNYKFIVLDYLTYAGNLDNISDEIKNSGRFEFVYGTINNARLVNLLMSRSDMVVHFAAESHVTNSIYEDESFFKTDVMGTRTLMRALVDNKNRVERFIHISTSEVYGTADYEPMDELHPLNPRSPYAAAKAGADRLVYSYWCTYDLPAVIVRPFNNYGPRQHPEKMIPCFVTKALNGEDLHIHGTGMQTRDWIHVKDTARAIDMMLHAPDFNKIKNQVINLGSGKKTSTISIANEILKSLNLGKDKLTHVADRQGQVACHIANGTKAKELLGWEPEITLDEGLKDTIEWYQKNKWWWHNSIIVAHYLEEGL